MTDFLRRLAAKSLSIEKVVAPRVPAFFETAAFAGGATDGGTSIEPESLSNKQEVLFESGRIRHHNETEYDTFEATLDDIPLERNNPEASSGSDPTKASGQFQNSSPLDVGRISGFLPPVYAEPHIRLGTIVHLPRSFSARSAKYISKDKREKAPGKVESQERDLLSDGSVAKKEYSNSYPFEWDLKNISFNLDESKMVLEPHKGKSDLSDRGRASHHRVLWVSDAHPPEQNSAKKPESDISQLDLNEKKRNVSSSMVDGFQSDGRPVEHKQNKIEDPLKLRRSKIGHSPFESIIDSRLAREPSKRAMLDQKPSISELWPEISELDDADLKRGTGNGLIHRESLSGAMAVKAARSGSIPHGKIEASDFKKINAIKSRSHRFNASKAIDVPQDASRSSEKVISPPMNPNPIKKQLMGVLLSQGMAGEKKGHLKDLSSSNSSSLGDGTIGAKISDMNLVGRHLEKANSVRIRSMNAVSGAILPEKPERQSLPQSNGANSTIQVTIGRIEVRAERPHQASPAPIVSSHPSTKLSLDNYLKQRSTGQL